jgi:multisubunit Na+/H+ antiporter MnhC subunit
MGIKIFGKKAPLHGKRMLSDKWRRWLGASRVVVAFLIVMQFSANYAVMLDFLKAVNLHEPSLEKLPWAQLQDWHYKSGIEPSEAAVIVTALVILVSTFSVTFISLSQSESSNPSQHIRLRAWFDSSQDIVLISQGVSVLVASTQFEQFPGLAVALIVVGLMCLGASADAISRSEENFKSKWTAASIVSVRHDEWRVDHVATSSYMKAPNDKPWTGVSSTTKSASYEKLMIFLLMVLGWTLHAFILMMAYLSWPMSDKPAFFTANVGGFLFYMFISILILSPFLIAIGWTASILIAAAQGKPFEKLFRFLQIGGIIVWAIMIYSVYDTRETVFVPITAEAIASLFMIFIYVAFRTGWGLGSPVVRLPVAFLRRLESEAECRYRQAESTYRKAVSGALKDVGVASPLQRKALVLSALSGVTGYALALLALRLRQNTHPKDRAS